MSKEPTHMQIVAEAKPQNPNLAFDRWDRTTERWVACSFQKMKPWDIWRYTMCRHSAELGDVVPTREMLDRADALKPLGDARDFELSTPSMAIAEVQADDVKRDQQIFINRRWWRVLGNHWIDADDGPVVYIWREGHCGVEDITVLERYEPSDLCVVK